MLSYSNKPFIMHMNKLGIYACRSVDYSSCTYLSFHSAKLGNTASYRPSRLATCPPTSLGSSECRLRPHNVSLTLEALR